VRSAGLENAAARLRAAGIGEARAAVVLESLEAVVAPAGATPAEATERDQLFAAWLEGLDALSGGAPQAWLVEDVHWASPDVLAFLAQATEADDARLVVATARPALLETAPDWCANAELLHLAPLPPADVGALIQALVGDALAAELVERIAERSGGNALFVEELLRTWIGTGVLAQQNGGWALAADLEEVGLPPTVQAIYAAQLDDLVPAARTAARHASVAGRRFPLEALPQLAVPDAREAVAVLERRALVGDGREEAALGRTLRFRHALLRDTAYASLARSDRAALHLEFADWLAGRPPEALPAIAEVIARHYAAAVETAPALASAISGRDRRDIGVLAGTWFEHASDVAAGVAAWESARTLAERALEFTSDDEPLSKARRLERLAQAAVNSTGAAEAERCARDALELYRASADRDGLSSAAHFLGRLLYSQARFAEAERLAEELIADVGEARDAATVRLLVMRAQAVLGGRDAYEPAGRDADRALEIARELGDAELELTVLEMATPLREERGDRDPGWAELEQAARRARRWPAVVNALRAQAGDRTDDDPTAVAPLLAPAVTLAEAHGLVEQTAWCDYVLAEAGLAAGQWESALETGLRAIAVGDERGFIRVVYRSWFVLTPIAHAIGRMDLLQDSLRPLPVWGDPLPSKSTFARVMVTAVQLRRAEAGLESPFVPEAEWLLPSFDLGHGGPSWIAGVETIVESWLAAGDLEVARRALDRMRASLETLPTSQLARASEALLRARLEGSDEARRALVLLGENGPWWRAKAIRLLEAAGEADSEQVGLADRLEAQLGIR
jgi:hypothetical protein